MGVKADAGASKGVKSGVSHRRRQRSRERSRESSRGEVERKGVEADADSVTIVIRSNKANMSQAGSGAGIPTTVQELAKWVAWVCVCCMLRSPCGWVACSLVMAFRLSFMWSHLTRFCFVLFCAACLPHFNYLYLPSSRYADCVPAEYPSYVPCIPKALRSLKLPDIPLPLLMEEHESEGMAGTPYYIVSGIESVLCGVYVHLVRLSTS